jgi:GDP-mannose 6-dehydrogenase
MNIVVCGLGYVGVTVAACLLRKGATVIGIDISAQKVQAAIDGHSPVKEPGVAELFALGRAEGRLIAAGSLDPHLAAADMVIVCVGTPSSPAGDLDLSHVREVSRQIGTALRRRPASAKPLLCVYRSTMLPGSMEGVVLPELRQASGEAPGACYEVAYNPEFMRESTAIADFLAPPKIVIGERFPGAAGDLLGIYDGIDAPTFRVPYAAAEMVKYVDNSFHALKVCFANETGRIALAAGVDPKLVTRMFLADTKLNISPYYLYPGGAFGGSCLPKDLRALNAFARAQQLEVPMLDTLTASNDAHKAFLVERVRAAAQKGDRILLLGLTFKDDSDDLRESPLLDLAVRLLELDYKLSIFEPDLRPEQLIGSNLLFARQHLPRLDALLVPEAGAAAAAADLVVFGKAMPGIADKVPPGKPVLNLHRL